ncbi:EamA family transporter [Cellulomonas pakistanensis]|uniref:Membrane protein n=1 Tax=Cellulomonas pakistanensis TaxID=992287 RepID=A0A919P7B8_9CELL|nr:EamA family transporter [Cellulomonas pakistanensis]GIG35421.1 membrane protein [Cellulomonas pakistanensis]
MPPRDRLLALAVAVIWGLNFPAIHLSLEQFPPFFLVALRFALLAAPTLLLVPRPVAPVRWLIGYGVGFGVLQFAFLYLAMDTGMPTGLASLVLQASAPFTVLLGAAWLRERITARQAVGVAVAICGLGGIAALRAGAGASAGLLPVVLTLCGGLGWAFGNVSSRQAHPDSPLRFMLWMSVVPPLPMLALSLVVDGPAAIGRSLTTLGTPTAAWALAGLTFTVLVATVVGSGIWTALLARHPSGVVAPFSMLVPVVGIGASWAFLGERPDGAELALGALVVAGVLVATRAPRRPARATPAAPAAPAAALPARAPTPR